MDHIERLHGRFERCRRCNTKIKWVWVMEKQTEPKQLWRIGNECGPQLEDMSQELWDTVAKPFERSIDHVYKLDRLAMYECDYPGYRPADYELGWAAEQVARLAAGITPNERRVMGSHVSQHEKAYLAAIRNAYAAQRKAEVAKAANSLPTSAHH